MSVPTNIVEGSGQESAREFARFLRIALNSATELEYHLIAARDLGAITGATSVTLLTQVVEVRKMIYGLLRHLACQPPKRKKPATAESTPDDTDRRTRS